MDVCEIIKKYLEENKFDGLFNLAAGCGCLASDIAPCGCFENCIPGYRVDVPKDLWCEYEYFVCKNKTDKPWE